MSKKRRICERFTDACSKYYPSCDWIVGGLRCRSVDISLSKCIVKEFEACYDALVAIGDETRELIIMTLLESDCNTIIIGEATEKIHFSRSAVSRYLKILKEAGIINMRREGTRNYYYMDANETQWADCPTCISTLSFTSGK